MENNVQTTNGREIADAVISAANCMGGSEVPAETVELRLDTGGAVSSAAVNGESLGVRGWSPFVWKVPPTLRGRTVDLRIDLWTSIRPAFGREDVPDAYPVGKLDQCFKVARLHKAEWILEEGQVVLGKEVR